MSESTSNTPSSDTPPPIDGAAHRPRSWGVITCLFFGRVFVGIFGLVVSVAILVGLALAVAYPNLPSLDSIVDYRPKLPLRILSADGVLLGEFGEERRSYLPIDDIPKVMQNAVLAAEDERFYEHGGVDYKGVLRAGIANLRRAGSQGASTITMQLARNFYLSSEKTMTRKIYEILLAFKIESRLRKEKILEVYMNQIYLGQRAYGFAAASEIYFGKPLKDISVAEAAMLAGLPKAPAANNPIVNPKRAEQRQRHIIGRMLEYGMIDAETQDLALKQELHYRQPTHTSAHGEYIAEAARQMVFAQYGDAAHTRGLTVHTSVRAADQLNAYQSLRRGIMDFERRQAYRGPEGFVDLPVDPKAMDARVADALEDYTDSDELRAAVILRVSPRTVDVMLANGETVSVSGEGLRLASPGLRDKAPANLQLRRGAVVRVARSTQGEWALLQLPEVEGAFVALDPLTGEVRAMVGGFDYGKNKFNHVTQAWRQPGSSFKPFIYSAALERGFTPATVVNDAPLFFDGGVTGSQPWEPKNYDGKFDGPMSMRTALAKSKNMVSIRLLQASGVSFTQDWVTRFGFDADKHPAYLTMALGAGSVTPMQMATGYAVFANGGYRVNPTLITRITDMRGKPLVQATASPLDETMRAIPPRNAFIMSSLLQEVTRNGTAAKAQQQLKRTDLYGKTGTTNDSMDAWFAGYQPGLVAVVWIGYDQPRKLGDKETGGGLSLPVWIQYMSQALKNVPVRELTAPDGVINSGGEWFYEEYHRGTGVRSLGMEDRRGSRRNTSEDAESTGTHAPAPDPEEKKSILDLFR